MERLINQPYILYRKERLINQPYILYRIERIIKSTINIKFEKMYIFLLKKIIIDITSKNNKIYILALI